MRFIRGFPACVLALALLPAPAPAADPPPGRDSSTGVYTVPSRMCGPFFLVPLSLPAKKEDEHRELIFLFDSGASVTLIDPKAVARLSGREAQPGERVALIGARAGPLTFSRLTASTRQLDHLARALGEPFDGVLGFSAFRDFLLTLDYPHARMAVSRGALPPPDNREVFDAQGADDRPWVAASAGGRTHRLLIDTGYSATFALRPQQDLGWRAAPVPVSAFVRLRTIELREAGRLDAEMRIGAHRFSAPLVYLTANSTELLGGQVLKHFSVTFDQRNRRVRLRRAGRAPIEIPPLSDTGAILRPRPEGLQVITVLKGSPADAAGLRAGDFIVRVDGRDPARRGCPVEDEMREGSFVTYEVQRGRELVKITVRRDVLVE